MEQPSLYFCLLIKNTWQKLSRYYNQQLASKDLSVTKAMLLIELPEKGARNPRTLAHNLNLENSSMSGLLDRMEKQGLLKRQRDPGDRRAILISLTERGRQAREEIKASVEALDLKMQELLSVEDIRNFRRIISTINRQI